MRGREDPGLVEQRRSAHVEILRFLQDGSLQRKKSEISLRIRKDRVDFFWQVIHRLKGSSINDVRKYSGALRPPLPFLLTLTQHISHYVISWANTPTPSVRTSFIDYPFRIKRLNDRKAGNGGRKGQRGGLVDPSRKCEVSWTLKREWQRLRPDIHDALRRRRRP